MKAKKILFVAAAVLLSAAASVSAAQQPPNAQQPPITTPQQEQQEEMAHAMAHAVEIHVILRQCGASADLLGRIDLVVRDYASRLPVEIRTRAINGGNASAQGILSGSARNFFCAEAMRNSAAWVSSIEMMRRGH